eukprot:TRINITY_DN913_c0_g1_i1.p1 TRINITY_DN913_c0_g1~~TRINITY_DN913_c0_g1_i1.p1  ORF type:complete len:202 (-),score=46.66 TRINITY_DN913_c0_g1_i1:98-661(-)
MSQPDKDQPNKETEPQRKLNPYDTNSVKACLDQSVIQFFDDKQFPEDHTLTTRKTILGGFGCLLALIAHFYPIPFPNNIPLLAVCVVLYFVTSALLQYTISFVEKDIIYTACATHLDPGLEVRTNLPRFSDIFTLSVQLIEDGKRTRIETLERSYGCWFSADGLFQEKAFHSDLNNLLRSLKLKKME